MPPDVKPLRIVTGIVIFPVLRTQHIFPFGKSASQTSCAGITPMPCVCGSTYRNAAPDATNGDAQSSGKPIVQSSPSGQSLAPTNTTDLAIRSLLEERMRFPVSRILPSSLSRKRSALTTESPYLSHKRSMAAMASVSASLSYAPRSRDHLSASFGGSSTSTDIRPLPFFTTLISFLDKKAASKKSLSS